MSYDLLIKNAKIFNDGKAPIQEDLAIKDGKVFKRGKDLDSDEASKVIDAQGHWLMPGLYDIHTHYDLELELDPRLTESTRHGTTSVVIANCSLGLAFGNQRDGDIDPIVDCYARVENLPKSLLKSCADKVDWNTPKKYLEHLQAMNLGPNVAVLLPHSMLRIEAMGFNPSISRDPSTDELNTMKSILSDAIDQGYVGFSTDALPFHYLANQPNCHKTIPTQFAKYSEIKALTDIVREKNATWQATPPKDSVIQTIKTFLLTSGRLHKKPLKVTLVAALDIANNWKIARLGKTMAKIMNSRLIQGDFHLQALGARFKTWADGAITPLAEEIPELRSLNETDLEDRQARLDILKDPAYIKQFKKMWMAGKTGFGINRLKRILNVEDYAFNRTLSDMYIDRCPHENWQGKNFQDVYDLILLSKKGQSDDIPEGCKSLIEKDFFWIADEADFVLQMLRTFDIDLSWSTINANRDLKTVRDLIMNPLLLPGFNDCGAHLTNMAFYDGNLRSLQLAAEGGDNDVSYIVKRLTKDAAEVFGIKGGTIYEGDTADLILVDPNALSKYNSEANTQRIYRDIFEHEQLVNRSDNIVPLTVIGGKIAWENNEFSDAFGTEPFGQLLKSS